MGVDISASIIERARSEHPEATFDVCDAWDLAGLQASARAHLARDGDLDGDLAGPEMVMVDVGGLSGAHGELDALALVRALAASFGPNLKAMVIKSHCLRTLALTLRSGHAVAKQ